MARTRAARIGIDVTPAVTQGGGIGRYTRELVWALAAREETSELHLFHARPPSELPVANPLPQGPHIRTHRAPLDDRWLYRLWHKLRAPLPVQAFTGRLDLFHSPDFVLPPVWGSVPTLLTVHDLSFVHYPEAFTPALVRYLERVVPASIARTTHVLADSQATRQDLMALWQVPGEKITVLYSGVSRHFRPASDGSALETVSARYGLGGRPYLLSVGTVQPRKNYSLLLRAFAPIAAQWPHRLVIVGGKGWLDEGLGGEVESLGLSERVRFVGFAADEDLPALYAGAALFLFPSLYEGFGIPLLEAMACGVPVVSSNSSSLPEVAGNAAVLLDPGDQAAWTATIHRLLLDAPRRTQLVAAGFRQVRHFSWKKAAEQLQSLYQALLGQRE